MPHVLCVCPELLVVSSRVVGAVTNDCGAVLKSGLLSIASSCPNNCCCCGSGGCAPAIGTPPRSVCRLNSDGATTERAVRTGSHLPGFLGGMVFMGGAAAAVVAVLIATLFSNR